MDNTKRDTNYHERIAVVGVGSEGIKALDTVIAKNLCGVIFIAIASDQQALDESLAQNKVQINSTDADGVGFNGVLKKGNKVDIEEINQIKSAIGKCDIVFVSAMMDADEREHLALSVAQAAKELGALTVGVIAAVRWPEVKNNVKPFANYFDRLIKILPDDMYNRSESVPPFDSLCKKAGETLYSAVRGVFDLIAVYGYDRIKHGLLNITSTGVAGFSREDLKILLAIVETLPMPTNKEAALCYSMSHNPNNDEYHCPVCKQKTIHFGLYCDETFLHLDSIRRIMKVIQNLTRDTISLRENYLCHHCYPEKQQPSLSLVISLNTDTCKEVHNISYVDVNFLEAFFLGRLDTADSYGGYGRFPLREKLPRLKELLGELDT